MFAGSRLDVARGPDSRSEPRGPGAEPRRSGGWGTKSLDDAITAVGRLAAPSSRPGLIDRDRAGSHRTSGGQTNQRQ
jgi:hypothetical protein